MAPQRIELRRLMFAARSRGLIRAASVRLNSRAQIIYHHETSGTQTNPFDHTGNIFRLNIKLSLPRKGWRYTSSMDIDESRFQYAVS